MSVVSLKSPCRLYWQANPHNSGYKAGAALTTVGRWQSRWGRASVVQEGRESSLVNSSSALPFLPERPMFFRAATNSGRASPQIPNHREAWSLRVGSSTGPLASGPVSMWHCVLGVHVALVLRCLKHSLPIESLELYMLSYVSDLRCREEFLNTCVFSLLNLRKNLIFF